MMTLRRCKGLMRSESGAAMVEFAIVLPVLLLIILGILQFGLLWYTKYVITAASREGAHYATVYTVDPTNNFSRVAPSNLTDPTVQGLVESYCNNSLSNTPVTVTPGGAGWTTGATGTDVTIQVTCQNPWNLLGSFLPGLSNIQLRAETTMKCE
jgi:Flp pilus assembly protein TadG